MIPTEAFALVHEDDIPESMLWRDPDGTAYVVSPPGEEARHEQQGHQLVGQLASLRARIEAAPSAGIPEGSPLGMLFEDTYREARCR